MNDDFDIEIIRDQIIKFKNDSDFQKLESFYFSKSFSEILGVSRREISHSGFLAWLLSNAESHKLDYFGIRKLLDIILKFSTKFQKDKHNDLLNSFVTENYDIEKLKVFPEYHINQVGRIDIYIELDVVIDGNKKNIKIIIENKVESKETKDQTLNYYNHFNKIESENQHVFYIYLTPISTLDLIELEEPECKCKQFIQINYQSIVDYLIEPALNQNVSIRTQNLLNEYLKSLSQPSIDLELADRKNELIMALGNEERNLLKNFWQKNKILILASLYAISLDPEQEKDTRDSIKEALDNLSSERDRSKLKITYNDKVFCQDIKKSDIGLQTVKLLNEYGLINDEILEFLKADKTASFPLIKTREEFTETEIKYRKYKVNEDPELIYDSVEYYVVRNWGIGNIHKFISKFEDKFPGIKYENY